MKIQIYYLFIYWCIRNDLKNYFLKNDTPKIPLTKKRKYITDIGVREQNYILTLDFN